VAVQVASDVSGLDECRRVSPEWLLAKLRGTPRNPEGSEDGRLVDAVG
jgi:hypothetical protein